MPTLPARTLSAAALGLLALLGGGCSEDDNNVAPVGSATYQRVYYWSNVLRKYPDLPTKVDAIIRDKERGPGLAAPYSDRLPGAQVVVHDGLVSYAFDAQTVDVIVTDLSVTALRALREEWRGVAAKAAELGIVPSATRASDRADRVIVLGSKGAIEIKGPNGSSQHSVIALHSQDTGHLFLSVHAFGSPGEQTLGRLLGAYNPHSPRGPPDIMGGTLSPRPPPTDGWPSGDRPTSLSIPGSPGGTNGLDLGRRLTIVVIGEVDSYRVGGASDSSQQTVNFCSFVNSHESKSDWGSETWEAAHYASASDERYRDYLKEHSYREPGTHSAERPGYHGRPGASEYASTHARPEHLTPRIEVPHYRPPGFRPRPGR